MSRFTRTSDLQFHILFHFKKNAQTTLDCVIVMAKELLQVIDVAEGPFYVLPIDKVFSSDAVCLYVRKELIIAFVAERLKDDTILFNVRCGHRPESDRRYL